MVGFLFTPVPQLSSPIYMCYVIYFSPSPHLVIRISSKKPVNECRSNHSECCSEAWMRGTSPGVLQDQAVEVPEELPEEFFR